MPTTTVTGAQTRLGDEEDYHFLYNPFHQAIVVDANTPSNPIKLFFQQPWYSPLLIPNESSDARDHCANERTYLSYLRLAVYLAVVSVAIFVNFHLKHQATSLEKRISHPLGIIFWVLALACLAAGFGNYVRTVAKYAKKDAIVQSGLKTQLVFGLTATAIIVACGVFIGAEAGSNLQRRALVKDAVAAAATANLSSSTEQSQMKNRLSAELLLLLSNSAGTGVWSESG